MTEGSNDPRIARVLAALASKDPSDMEAICDPEMIVEDPSSLPFGGVYKGFGGMCELASKLFEAVSDCKIETQRVLCAASGDEFVLLQRMTGRAASTGRPIDMPILEHYCFKGDRVISIRPFYWDSAALADLLSKP